MPHAQIRRREVILGDSENRLAGREKCSAKRVHLFLACFQWFVRDRRNETVDGTIEASRFLLPVFSILRRVYFYGRNAYGVELYVMKAKYLPICLFITTSCFAQALARPLDIESLSE